VPRVLLRFLAYLQPSVDGWLINFTADSLGGNIMLATGVSVVSDIPYKAHWPVKLHWFANAGRLGAWEDGMFASSLLPLSRLRYRYCEANTQADKSLTSQIASAISKPSISAGVGLMYRMEPIRVEVNVGLPIVQSRGEKARKGLQVGLGIDFL
jgi:outer membrane protein insertion porin family